MPNGNRFLAEGLAVHLQNGFGDSPSYPNFGRSLEALIREAPPERSLAALDARSTPRRLGDTGSESKIAYLAAGSFIRFLIARYRLERFKSLNALTPY